MILKEYPERGLKLACVPIYKTNTDEVIHYRLVLASGDITRRFNPLFYASNTSLCNLKSLDEVSLFDGCDNNDDLKPAFIRWSNYNKSYDFNLFKNRIEVVDIYRKEAIKKHVKANLPTEVKKWLKDNGKLKYGITWDKMFNKTHLIIDTYLNSVIVRKN